MAMARKPTATFDRRIVVQALRDSVRKLDPRTLVRNPVMFVVEVGSVIVTLLFLRDLPSATAGQSVFASLVAAWLWFTVLFANFAEAMAEGRGKAQAATLRKTRSETTARRRTDTGDVEEAPSTQLAVGDVVVVGAGEIIPGDGDVIEGVASVDESAVTGESAPVIRESGGDRSAVTGGTKVLSDEIVVRITAAPGESFLDRMIGLVEGASRQKTPNEIALSILLAGLTIVFLLVVVTLQPFAIYSGEEQTLTVLLALLVCLIPTTIGALLSAIGIAGMDRLVQRNVLAMSGRAVEAAGDCNTLLLDKTGTITIGDRQADELIPLGATSEDELAEVAQLSSLSDETPEGRSIVVLAKQRYGLRERSLDGVQLVPFTAETRMSGFDQTARNDLGRHCPVRHQPAARPRRTHQTQAGTRPEPTSLLPHRGGHGLPLHFGRSGWPTMRPRPRQGSSHGGAVEGTRTFLTGDVQPRPGLVGTFVYGLLFGGLLLDLITSQDLVVAILYNIPIAVSAVAVSRYLTRSAIVIALVANLLAAYENAENIGSYDGIVLANRGLAALSFLIVGAITLARIRAVDESQALHDVRDLAVREQRLRVFGNAVARAVTTDELLDAATEALSVLLDAGGVAVGAVHDGHVAPEGRNPQTGRRLAPAGTDSTWATEAIPRTDRRTVTLRNDSGRTTAGWLRQPNGDPLVVIAHSPSANDPTGLLADALDILEPLLRRHLDGRSDRPDDLGPERANGGPQ